RRASLCAVAIGAAECWTGPVPNAPVPSPPGGGCGRHSGKRLRRSRSGPRRRWRPGRLAGVWVSDVPPDADERAATLLVVNLRVPPASLAAYEVEAGTRRAWCIPADVLNQAASITMVADG